MREEAMHASKFSIYFCPPLYVNLQYASMIGLAWPYNLGNEQIKLSPLSVIIQIGIKESFILCECLTLANTNLLAITWPFTLVINPETI